MKGETGFYRVSADAPLFMSGDIAPLNYQAAMGQAAYSLYIETGKNFYLERAKLISNFIKSKINLDHNNFEWPYSSEYGRSEDTAHAVLVVNFLMMFWSDKEKERVSKVINNNFFNEENVSLYVDGKGSREAKFNYIPALLLRNLSKDQKINAIEILKKGMAGMPYNDRYDYDANFMLAITCVIADMKIKGAELSSVKDN